MFDRKRAFSSLGTLQRICVALASAGLMSLVAAGCVPDSTGAGPGDDSDTDDGPDCESGEMVNSAGDCVPIPDGGRPDTGLDATDGGGMDVELELPTWGDKDNDSQPNEYDNCPRTPNNSQTDSDNDGFGDACDNCPEVPNVEQIDSDDDETGDKCEEGAYYNPDRDGDGDGAPDVDDNCPEIPNTDQADNDNDNVGNVCDNCPDVANYTQVDTDDDGDGDACSTSPPSNPPIGFYCEDKSQDFQEVPPPNVFVLVDESGSMDDPVDSTTSTRKIDAAQNAIEGMVDYSLNNNLGIRFALGSFDSHSCPGMHGPHLNFSSTHTSTDVANAFNNNINAQGGTTLGHALEEIKNQQHYSDPSDPMNANRPKAVIAISDGKSSDLGVCAPPEHPAGEMHNAHDVFVYAIGFGNDANMGQLDAIASAGGTNAERNGMQTGGEAYLAPTGPQLGHALEDIAQDIIGCEYTLKQGVDPDRIWVSIGGNYQPKSAYSYDPSNRRLTLSNSACQQLRALDSNSSGSPLTIKAACEPDCDTDAEDVCDYKDNDCDGEVDEDCTGCAEEVCGNDQDDDCDMQVDEGCPDCQLVGQSCSSNGDCCKGVCDQGTCVPDCRPLNAPCANNGQCCSDNCIATTDGKICSDG